MPRPVRNRKIVDYSQCGDFDDDEDFACASTPPSKKPRLKVDQKPKKEKNIKNSGSQDSKFKNELPKERLPLDEKVYQRNLKTALVLSVQESSSEGLDKTTAEDRGFSEQPRQGASEALLKQSKILLDDRSRDGECTKDSGSEEEHLTTEESESNGSSADASDEFTFQSLSNQTKKKVIKTQTKREEKKILKSNSRDTAPLLLEELPVPPPSSKLSEASSPSSGTRKSKWMPPASKENSNASQEGVSVRSPSQGLRLGLSRFAKVKPLHPCVDNSRTWL
ncbi:RAD51-associated protein 1 [Narcine bancroftii]|uniref:RAD51-associated protein 1 n=1 Tax=Narcine bancroftii TaxID=1343680 RepID=UPI0038315CD1